MKHTNIANWMMMNPIWMTTEAHAETLAGIAERITAGDIVALRQAYDKAAAAGDAVAGGTAFIHEESRTGIAEMVVRGTIMPRANMFMAMSGGVSAELVASTARTLAKMDDIHTVILNVDSPGGNVQGMEDAATAIRELRETKRVIAIGNHNIFSGGYYLASQADQIFVMPDSDIGSIGVLMVLHFAADEKKQLVKIIRSVPGKASVNPYEDLSEEDEAKLQAEVNLFHDNFVQAVSKGRKISIEQAQKLADGSTHLGAEAVELGYADGLISNMEELFERIEAMESADAKFGALKEEFTSVSANLETAQAQLAAATAEIAELKAAAAKSETDSLETTATAKVEAAIEAEKLHPGQRDALIEQIVEGKMSIEAFDLMVSNISATPIVTGGNGEISMKDAPSGSDELTEEEKRAFSTIPSLAKKFNLNKRN